MAQRKRPGHNVPLHGQSNLQALTLRLSSDIDPVVRRSLTRILFLKVDLIKSEFLRAQGIMSEAPTSEKSRSKRASVRRNPSGTAAPPSVTPNEGVLTPSPTPSPKTGKANLDRMVS